MRPWSSLFRVAQGLTSLHHRKNFFIPYCQFGKARSVERKGKSVTCRSVVPSISSSAVSHLILPPQRGSMPHGCVVCSRSRLRLQNAPRPGPRESHAAAAARRPPSFGETPPRVGLRPWVLGSLIHDLEGLEAVAGPRETGDSYTVAPLRFQTLLDMEEPEASARSTRRRSPGTRPDPEDEQGQSCPSSISVRV